MSKLIAFLSYLGSFIYPWLTEVSTAIVACALVVFGSDINRFLRRYLTGRSFIIRTLVFVLVNAFGYGVIIVKLTPVLADYMAGVPSHWLFLLTLIIFIVIGGWAQRNKQV